MKNKLQESSSVTLSRKNWRFIRRFMSGNMWSFLFSFREKIHSFFLIKSTINLIKQNLEKNNSKTIMFPKLDDLFLKDSLFLIDQKSKISKVWERFNACEKENHGYLDIYSPILQILEKSKNNRILEIGIWKGGSHRAWNTLLPTAEIFGIDIDKNSLFQEKNIVTFAADQLNLDDMKRTLEKISGKLDLVVDDGWHQPEAGLKTLSVSLPFLNVGGFHVIEDIKTVFYGKLWLKFLKLLPNNFESLFIHGNRLKDKTGLGRSVIIIRRIS